MISVLDWVENSVGKRRKYLLAAFSPFPECFLKASFLESLKLHGKCLVKDCYQKTFNFVMLWGVGLYID